MIDNEAVVAAADGVVEDFLDDQPNTYLSGKFYYGNFIRINHENGYKTTYGHLLTGSKLVERNQRVYKGQRIATSGNTGYSSGPHLHFEVWGPSSGGVYSNGAYKYDPYGLYTADGNVDPYRSNAMDETKSLWTTNPPSYAAFNITSFNFPLGSSEGMVPNWSMVSAPLGNVCNGNPCNEWRVQVNGPDPGVDSPSYPPGIFLKDGYIDFSAKVTNGGDPRSEGAVWIMDQSGNWLGPVGVTVINPSDYNNGQYWDAHYNVYRADLSGLSQTAQMKQFSIQLTNGHGNQESWTFDWIRIGTLLTSWDFTSNQMGWTTRNAVSDGFFGNDWWQINPNETDPGIISLYLKNVDAASYPYLNIRMTVSNVPAGFRIGGMYFEKIGPGASE
ncbi:M23 family metallopeptidase [Candidatus Falkowbacteria bacterium]|nr:M23 family metallopeptidase [Candidatus Falkowbacteria bacterium]